MVRRVAALPARLLKGNPGEQGIQGTQGPKGTDGADGAAGRAPEHEIKNGEIRFKQPDGAFGEWLSVTSAFGGGKVSNNTYTAVTTSTYHVSEKQLDLGTNIFGMRVTPATLYIPKKIDRRCHIVVKDEDGKAGTNNITIQVET